MLCLDEANKAAEYIEGIADSYRQAGKSVYAGHPVLAALLNSKQKIAETKNIDFACVIKCDVTNIDIPPWDLCSILGNLLDNAFEAALLDQSNRRVTMEIKYENANYVIYVDNTGPKMSEKIKSRLFDAGYTAKESTARGYGLYLVKKLVDKYEGKIDVTSKAKTTFIVHFPDRGKRISDQKTCTNSYHHRGRK